MKCCYHSKDFGDPWCAWYGTTMFECDGCKEYTPRPYYERQSRDDSLTVIVWCGAIAVCVGWWVVVGFVFHQMVRQ